MSELTKFDESYKDIDLSSVDVDSHSFDRKFLECEDAYYATIRTIEEFCGKEFDLANNNDEELHRVTLISKISNDREQKIERATAEFIKELAEIYNTCEKKTDYPYYFRRMFIGSSQDYPRLLNGLEYFIKQIDENTIDVFDDCKFSRHMGKFTYNENDWKVTKLLASEFGLR